MAGFNLNDLLNGKSKAAVQEETVAQEQETESTFEVVMLDVEDLMPSKDNFYSTEDIDELALSIELSGGIEQNLVVKPQAHGKYEIIAGHRRRLATMKLINEGKEQFRKVPCRIKKESDEIKDRLALIFTNSTARQLTDWEKLQQAKELKEVLTEYKKALQEENKDKPKEERVKMGRIRDIVAEMLNTSTTQIGRMEAIDNNLSESFKEELEKGNIGISTAHELSRLDEEGQKKAYEQYEEKGELHIKDVKEEKKPEITEEQVEWIRKALKDSIVGPVNRKLFELIKKNNNKTAVADFLRKQFGNSFQGKKIELENGSHFIYRYQAEGITLIDKDWHNYLIEYADLVVIIEFMIEGEVLTYDDTPEEEEQQKEEVADGFMNAPEEMSTAAVQEEQEEEETEEESDNLPLPGQMDVTDYPSLLNDVTEDNLSFTEWIGKRYGTGQYNMIKRVVRDTILSQAQEDKAICPKEWEDRLTNAFSVWLMDKTKEYKEYLQR